MESLLIHALARAVIGLVGSLPRASAARLLNLCAAWAYLVDPRHRYIARVNLKIAFPEASAQWREAIALASFKNTARNLLEVSRMPRLSPGTIGNLVEYDSENGLNNFAAARSLGRGILYITGHFSAWELLPTAHALHGHPLSFVTRPLDNPLLERYMVRIRQAAGNTVISRRNSARQILETLKRAGDVGLLIDQNTQPHQEGVFVDLFGVPAATTSGAALFALRTDAPVLPGYLTPMRNGRYRIKFLPPVELVCSGDKTRDIYLNTLRFNQVMERIIREQPESWLWGHKRWSYQPPGNPQNLYRLSEKELDAFLLRSQRRSPSSTGAEPCDIYFSQK